MQRVEFYEKAFLSLAAIMLVVFLGALGYAAVDMRVRLPGRSGEIDPRRVRETPPFDHPGVREVAPGEYRVVMIGQTWTFLPNEVHVPAGAKVTFEVTSPDVIHGFYVEGTRINAMLIPGQITEVTYTFREPGEHLLICHEYCGVGHQGMYGKVIVE